MNNPFPPRCIDCKYFAISHPEINSPRSEAEQIAFIQKHVISNGVCLNPKFRIRNPVTGNEEYPFAIVLRKSSDPELCGPEGKDFEPLNTPKTEKE